MISVFFHFQHTLNIFSNNCKGVGGGWESIWEKFQKKTTLKKPSLIRVKPHGFYRSLPQRNFISFSLRKTFFLTQLLAIFRLKNYHEFLRFFLCDQPYRFRNTSQTSELKSNSENVSARTWFVHFDGLCNYLNLFQKQPAANFFNSCCLPVQGH